jgi:hypothetical protein
MATAARVSTSAQDQTQMKLLNMLPDMLVVKVRNSTSQSTVFTLKIRNLTLVNTTPLDKGMFSSILSQVTGGGDDAPHHRPAGDDEIRHAANAHQQIYNEASEGRPSSEHSSSDLGSAAAMQAMKMFSGGGGGGGSSELIGLAMGEATKLFNAQGGGGDKNAVVSSAAQMAMKFYISKQMGGGGSGGGGLGSLMGMLGGGNSGGGMAASLIGKLL